MPDDAFSALEQRLHSETNEIEIVLTGKQLRDSVTKARNAEQKLAVEDDWDRFYDCLIRVGRSSGKLATAVLGLVVQKSAPGFGDRILLGITDKFYPDFVAELTDGRILVVEYKGADRWSNDDSKEKRAVGELWADRSQGKCLFIMPQGPDWAAIEAKIRS